MCNSISCRDIIFRSSQAIGHIEITSWLVSAYDFYSRVVKDPSQRVDSKNRTNEPTMK